MALAFLLNKKFHPATLQNQKRLYIAEEKARDQEKRQKEYEKQLRQEKDYLDARKALSGKLEEDEGKRGVSFMYEPPPGYLAAVAAASKVEEEKKPDDRPEWAKNAPVAGAFTEGMKVNFRPLGIEVRNMRCIRCGERGHSTGDRECMMKDHNPNDSQRMLREDPMSALYAGSKPGSTKFVMKTMDREVDPSDPNSQILAESEDEVDPEYEFLASLSEKEKKKLLKELKKKRKEKKPKKDKERKRSGGSKGSRKSKSSSCGDESDGSDSSSSSSDSEKSDDSHHKKKKHAHKKDRGAEKSKVRK